MLLRIQSIYLAIVFIIIGAFGKLVGISLWERKGLMGLTCLIIAMNLYTIFRHDNRKLQLRLIGITNCLLILSIVAMVISMGRSFNTCAGNSCAVSETGEDKYEIGIVLFLMALGANVGAGYHIKQDEKLVNEDNLR